MLYSNDTLYLHFIKSDFAKSNSIMKSSAYVTLKLDFFKADSPKVVILPLGDI